MNTCHASSEIYSRQKSYKLFISRSLDPFFEYTDVVWDDCSQCESNDLEKSQNEAAQILTGAFKLVYMNALLTKTRWETLSSRRKKHKLILFNICCHLTLLALFQITLEAFQGLVLEIFNTRKLYMHIHSFTLIRALHQLSENGMSF